MTAEILTIDFTDEDAAGIYLSDFFTGSELLEGGDNFIARVNASFASDEIALDWLRKSYKGADVDGVGVTVDGEPL